jgi:hypothetical protein
MKSGQLVVIEARQPYHCHRQLEYNVVGQMKKADLVVTRALARSLRRLERRGKYGSRSLHLVKD